MNNILFLILNDKFPWSISHIQFLLIINSNFPRVPAHSLLAFGICHFLFSFRFRYLFLSAFFFWPRRNEFSNILSLKFFFSPSPRSAALAPSPFRSEFIFALRWHRCKLQCMDRRLCCQRDIFLWQCFPMHMHFHYYYYCYCYYCGIFSASIFTRSDVK